MLKLFDPRLIIHENLKFNLAFFYLFTVTLEVKYEMGIKWVLNLGIAVPHLSLVALSSFTDNGSVGIDNGNGLQQTTDNKGV